MWPMQRAVFHACMCTPGHAWSAPACHLPYSRACTPTYPRLARHLPYLRLARIFHTRAQRANEAAAALRTQQHAARQQQHVCARTCTGTCLCVRTHRPWVKLGAPKPACTHAATAAAAAIATHCKGLRPYHPTGPHATTLCICALRIGSGAGCDRGVARDGVLGRQRLRDPRRLAVLHRRRGQRLLRRQQRRSTADDRWGRCCGQWHGIFRERPAAR